VVSKETSFIATHAHVLDQQACCGRGIGLRIECTGIVGYGGRDGRVEVLDLAQDGADEVCGIRWDGWQGFGTFRVDHLKMMMTMRLVG
jgi:hypothetical protein